MPARKRTEAILSLIRWPDLQYQTFCRSELQARLCFDSFVSKDSSSSIHSWMSEKSDFRSRCGRRMRAEGGSWHRLDLYRGVQTRATVSWRHSHRTHALLIPRSTRAVTALVYYFWKKSSKEIMATYAQFKHVELYKIGHGKNRWVRDRGMLWSLFWERSRVAQMRDADFTFFKLIQQLVFICFFAVAKLLTISIKKIEIN